MFQAPVSREVTAADVVADLRYLADPAHESEMSYMYTPIKGTDDERHRERRERSASRPSTATPSASRSSTPSPSSPTPSATRPSGSGRWTTCARWAARPTRRIPWARDRTGSSRASPARPSTWSATPSGGTPPAGRTSTPSTTRCSAASRSMMLAFQKGMIDWTLRAGRAGRRVALAAAGGERALAGRDHAEPRPAGISASTGRTRWWAGRRASGCGRPSPTRATGRPSSTPPAAACSCRRPPGSCPPGVPGAHERPGALPLRPGEGEGAGRRASAPSR